MFIRKNFGIRGILNFSGIHIIWLTAWAALVPLLFQLSGWEWLAIPWLPLSVIGTAVAFYIGFKNNQAYDRLWEARKIWGGIVNSSRAWGSIVKSFVGRQFTTEVISDEDLASIKRTLIYRHIAWLYALRSQLLLPTPWEHISQGGGVARFARQRQKTFGIGLLEDEITIKELEQYLLPGEHERLINFQNTATQIIDLQSQTLVRLRERDIIEDFRHMEMQNVLNTCYEHQGKCERIKKFPLPRQYGGTSFVFVGIFIFLLPFGMVAEFQKLGPHGLWASIPFTVLVGWVYLIMELVGDYSENPFEGMGNDIPMYSLCRTIEIDLKEMLGETDLPAAVESKNGVLM